MKLKAKFSIDGVKSVDGQPKECTTAAPGQLFTPADDKTGKRLLEEGAAVQPDEDLQLEDVHQGINPTPPADLNNLQGDKFETGELNANKSDGKEEVPEPKKSSPLEKQAARVTDKTEPAKSNKPNKAPSLDDLGLGDGSKDSK